ncbi:hypothetical protein VP01_36g13 [Puccinia sorghi]|uniref:Uncharacterized protein n=1 Tax=Puccinia sorghi TaxID=27349 RepID=A0A0L6UUB6_9BASI|nr:hypothetical protein VP01_36g13 [Puccinia sorghi]
MPSKGRPQMQRSGQKIEGPRACGDPIDTDKAGGRCPRWAFGSTIQEAQSSAFTAASRSDPGALESCSRQPAISPKDSQFWPDPISQTLLDADFRQPRTVESTGYQIRRVADAGEASISKVSAAKIGAGDEAAELLDDSIECKRLATSSARPRRTKTDNRLHKRSLDSKQKCRYGKLWRRLCSKILKVYNGTRQMAIVWLLTLLRFLKFKSADRAMLKIKLARFFRINFISSLAN